MRLKPGWYLLGFALLYGLIVSLGFSAVRQQVNELRQENATLRQQAAFGPTGFVFPIAGACVPKGNEFLPGAPRPYRKGVNAGFVFVNNNACTPVVMGVAVVAAGGGQVLRAELDYREATAAQFQALLRQVQNGATEQQLDVLRGREVWIKHPDNSVTVYGHLSLIAPEIKVGRTVKQGEWIGRVGNSGTLEASRGSRSGVRLLFEHWLGQVGQSRFVGQDLRPTDVVALARERYGAALR